MHFKIRLGVVLLVMLHFELRIEINNENFSPERTNRKSYLSQVFRHASKLIGRDLRCVVFIAPLHPLFFL